MRNAASTYSIDNTATTGSKIMKSNNKIAPIFNRDYSIPEYDSSEEVIHQPEFDTEGGKLKILTSILNSKKLHSLVFGSWWVTSGLESEVGTGGIRDNRRYQQESQKKASKVIDERSMDRAKGIII